MYLINRSPTQVVHNKTPFEAWHGVKLAVSHHRVFGCIAFALIPSYKLHKLDEKFKKCLFIGYYPESKAYKLYNPLLCKVIISRDVVFYEDTRWNWETSHGDELVIEVEDKIEDPVIITHNPSSGESIEEESSESARHSSHNSVKERSSS